MDWVLCGSSALFTLSEESDGEQEQGYKHTSLVNDILSSHAEVSKEFEVDYLSSCTTLYCKLEQGQWECVVTFLESGYWPDNFFADRSSPSDQARTWVTRRDAENPNKIRWSQLPLHVALVVGAPFGIIRLLIGLYPESVYCADDEAMLPLHLAMRYGSSDRIVDLLLACYPDAINVKGKIDRTPLECALRGEDQVRGRILSVFVEGAKAKASKTMVTQCSREVLRLKEELKGKERELVKVRGKLRILNKNIVKAQSEFTQKIDNLKTSQNKIFEKTNKKILELAASKQLEEHLLEAQIGRLLVEERELEVAQQKAVEEAEIVKGLNGLEVKLQNGTDPALVSIRSKLYNLHTARAAVESEHAREVDKLKARLAIFFHNSNKKIEALEKAKLGEECLLHYQIDELKAKESELETDEAFKAIEIRVIQSFQDESNSVYSGLESKDISSQSEAQPQIDHALKLIETRLIRSLNDKSTKKPISLLLPSKSDSSSMQGTTDFGTSETNSKDEKATVEKVPRKMADSLFSMSTTVSVDTRQDDPSPLKNDPTLLARVLCMDYFSPTGVGPTHKAVLAFNDIVGAPRGLSDDAETGTCGMNALKTYLSLGRSEAQPQETCQDVPTPLESFLYTDNSMIESTSNTDVKQTKIAAEHTQQNDDDCLKPGDLDPAETVTGSFYDGEPAQELAGLSNEHQETESTVLKSKASHEDAPSTTIVSSTVHEICATIGDDTRKNDRHPTEGIIEQESDSNDEQTNVQSTEEVGPRGEIKMVDSKFVGGHAASLDDSDLANVASTIDSTRKDRHHDDLNSIDSLTEQAISSADEQTKDEITREESVELELSHFILKPSPIDTSNVAPAANEHKPAQANTKTEQTVNIRTTVGLRKSYFTKESASTRPPLFRRAHSNKRSSDELQKSNFTKKSASMRRAHSNGCSRIKPLNAIPGTAALANVAKDSNAIDRPALPHVDSLETSVKQEKTETETSCTREVILDVEAPSVTVETPQHTIQPDKNGHQEGDKSPDAPSASVVEQSEVRSNTPVEQKEVSSFAAIVERTKASLGHVSDSSSSRDDSIFLHVDEMLSMISNAEISQARVESDLSDTDEPRVVWPHADEDETRQDEPLDAVAAPPIVITFSGQRSQVGQQNGITAQCSREECIEIQCSNAATSNEFGEHVVAAEISVGSTTTTTILQSDQSKTRWQKYVNNLFRNKKHKEQQQKTATSPKNGTMVEEVSCSLACMPPTRYIASEV